MRALCGAIITAGALIGCGLTAIGYGIRYQHLNVTENPETHHPWGAPSMAWLLGILIAAVFVGLGIAFVGLMYHHERRHREHLRDLGHTTTGVGPHL